MFLKRKDATFICNFCFTSMLKPTHVISFDIWNYWIKKSSTFHICANSVKTTQKQHQNTCFSKNIDMRIKTIFELSVLWLLIEVKDSKFGWLKKLSHPSCMCVFTKNFLVLPRFNFFSQCGGNGEVIERWGNWKNEDGADWAISAEGANGAQLKFECWGMLRIWKCWKAHSVKKRLKPWPY